MEKQKIFWVILSVSIFMVVLLIVGVFVVRQKPAAAVSTETVSPLSDIGTRIFEYGTDTPSSQAQGASNEPEVLKFIIGEETPEAAAPKTEPQTVPQAPQIAQAPETAAQQQKTPPAAEPKAEPKTEPKAEPKVEVTQGKQEPAQAAPQKAAPKEAAPPRTVKTVEYWIQTGSYKSQTRAEDMSTLLTSKGLPGRVLSYSLEGDTYFRVRVGPYTNKNEAGKFLTIVKQIQGLEASYISSVTSTRAVN